MLGKLLNLPISEVTPMRGQGQRMLFVAEPTR